MTTHRVARAILTLLFVVVGGCGDMYMVTSQFVQVAVADPASGHTMPGAIVDLAHANRFQNDIHRNLSEGQYLDLFSNRRQTTDTNGEASLDVDIHTIVGGLLSYANPKLDRMTGEPYLMRIRKGKLTEMLTVVMVPGATKTGSRFKVTVMSVGAPRRLQ